MYVASVNQNVITCNHLFINKWIRLCDKCILLFCYAVKSWLLFPGFNKNILKIFINLSGFITLNSL